MKPSSGPTSPDFEIPPSACIWAGSGVSILQPPRGANRNGAESQMKRNLAGVFVAMAIGCGFSTLASAEVFNLAPGSLLHLSGTVGINIQNGLETGSGSFV